MTDKQRVIKDVQNQDIFKSIRKTAQRRLSSTVQDGESTDAE